MHYKRKRVPFGTQAYSIYRRILVHWMNDNPMALLMLLTVSLTEAIPGRVKLEGALLRARRLGKHLPRAVVIETTTYGRVE
jgi:hypothetical protein